MRTDLSEVIQGAQEAAFDHVHVALPGKVVSYNATKQTAQVRVGVKRAVPTGVEGEFVTESIPDVYDVPVCWPRGNGQHFAPGLAAGDGVLLVIVDIDPATWVRTGEVSDPGDLRRFDLSHAVCIPGFAPAGAALPPTAKDLRCLDAEIGGTADAAALASVVDAILANLQASTPSGTETGFAAFKLAMSSYLTSASAVLKLGS